MAGAVHPDGEVSLEGNLFDNNIHGIEKQLCLGDDASLDHDDIPITSSILLLDDQETLQVGSSEELAKQLSCPQDIAIKVITIFGNTGDGKSHTLNHTFFNGDEVFSTSPSQVSCTVGMWAAYDRVNHLLILDTEGLLSTSKSDSHQRNRLLMKVMAISDVIIYRTKAERLHSDMFNFLGDASDAYVKHFTPELKAALRRGQLSVPLCSLGPAVVVFHETQHTNTLGNNSDEEGRSAEELLQIGFRDMGRLPQAFSSLKYVGTRTLDKPTNFGPLFQTVMDIVSDTSVRSWRLINVVYNVLNHLNEKFSGDIDHVVPSTFPDSYFTCSTKCQSCNARCEATMNHVSERIPHSSRNGCIYQAQYDNKYYTCRSCHDRGKTNTVMPKAHASTDSSWIGMAKYAWSGYVLECSECGIIYRSRQYWYGNTDPVMTIVRTELKHVWPGEHCSFVDGSHTGRRVLDGLNTFTNTVKSVGQTPTRYVKDVISGAIAPSYWVPNTQIKECSDCGHVFDDQRDTKHHCRACGQGFCYECTQYQKPVPEKGWGPTPVKVCKRCHDAPGIDDGPQNDTAIAEINDLSALDEALEEEENKDLTARKVTEVIHTSMSKLSAVVLDAPRELINAAARPTYWVPDENITQCYCCHFKFRFIDAKHHCRACGHGVCDNCSKHRKPVPLRGWDHAVRVCDKCTKK